MQSLASVNSPRHPSPVTCHLVALGAYFLLTLVLTYPLILHFTTHVAGDGSDDPALAWNLWWVPYSILNLGSSPIYTNYMFFPIGLNLGFYTLTYLNAFLSIPIQFAFGVIPAANVNLILSFTLSGYGAYLLVTYLLRQTFLNGTRINADERGKENKASLSASQVWFAAFAAGLLYAFSANKFLYASLGQFNIASSQWIPFYILFLLKILDTPKPPLTYGFLLGFFLLAQALSEFIFASFLILFTIAYLVYWFIANRKSKIENQATGFVAKIINLLVAVIVFTIPMLPILAAMISDTLTEGDFIQQGLGFSNIFSADLTGFFIPSHLHPLFGSLETLMNYPYMNFMYLGFTAIVLGIIAFWKVKPARTWGIWFAIFALLSLGPTLRVNGAEFDLPMPFDILLEIPFIKGNRYPSRWSVMLTLTLAILVGYGIAYCVSRIANRNSQMAEGKRRAVGYSLSALVCALLVFEHLSTPLPLSNLQSPSIYSEIARDAGNFSVMEIPLAWRNGFRVTGSYRNGSQGPIDRIFMYAQFYQTTQQHPILNGNTSRNPELKFQYFAETPVLNSLVAIQMGHDIDEATRARDKELAPRVLQFFGTKYIIWHAPYEEANRDVANKTRAYIEENFPVTKISESYENGRGTVTYRVNDLRLPDALYIHSDTPDYMDSSLYPMYFGEGWAFTQDSTVWAQRPQAKIFVPLDSQGRDVVISGSEHMIVNGHDIVCTDPLCNGTVRVPAQYLNVGMNKVVLLFDKSVPTSSVREGNYLFHGCCNPPFNLLIRSAGEEQGDFAHIFVDGVDYSPNQRGYNIVVIDPKTARVEESAAFDTFASEEESARMVQFIRDIPNGKVVAVAVRDEASTHLTQEAVDALNLIGSRQDLRGKFRWSHALVGTKGFGESEMEYIWETRPAEIIVGIGASEPRLYAQIGEIGICPVIKGTDICP